MTIRATQMFTMQALSGGEVINLPNPDKDSAGNIIATFVNSARNAAAVVVAQKIGRDQCKTELSWSYLEKDIWEKLLRFWDKNFFFKFTYYDRVLSRMHTRVYYIGDRSDRPFDITANGIPTAYIECKANIIDTGESA